MPTRQRKTKGKSEFRKAYERQQVKLQKALRRYRIGPSVPDEPAAPWFPAFQYKFPADFPRAEQETVEAALKKANQSFSNQRPTAGSYIEYKAVYDKWLKEIVEAYAQAIRRVAGSLPSEQWSPMGRVDELQRYAKAAASLVHLAGIFDSKWWPSLVAAVRAPVTKAPAAKRTKRELTADEIAELYSKTVVTRKRAEELLQVGSKQINNLLNKGRWMKAPKAPSGKGKARIYLKATPEGMITTESIRIFKGLQDQSPRDFHHSERFRS